MRKREERERNGGKERESKYFGSEKKVSRTCNCVKEGRKTYKVVMG